MAELFEMVKLWFLGLGERYGVNPIIFGSIYVGAIPFFTFSMAWIIRNYKKEKSIVLPSLCAVGCFISAYVYLIIVGKNVPWWVYGTVSLIVAYGGYSTYRKVKKRIVKSTKNIIGNE